MKRLIDKIFLVVNQTGSIVYRTNVLAAAKAEARERKLYTNEEYEVNVMTSVWSTKLEDAK